MYLIFRNLYENQSIYVWEKFDFHLWIVRKITFPTGLCLWIMPCCCVSKHPGFSNGFCPYRAAGKWSMEEHLWYLFVAGVTAGCSCRGEAGSLSPTASPCLLSERFARLVRLPEYFTLALQILPKGLLPHLCRVLKLQCKTQFGLDWVCMYYWPPSPAVCICTCDEKL